MDRKTIVIGIDCPNNAMLTGWMEGGLLPNLQSLHAESSVGTLSHKKLYSNQNSWIPFLTGRSLEKIDYWVSTYQPRSYDNINHCLFNLHEHQPFYALGERARVTMFDLPVAINSNVQGIQVSGWASELNETFAAAEPPEMLHYITDRYGTDPKMEGALEFYNAELDRHGRSYRVPSAYDIQGLKSFRDKLLASIATRGEICRELLARGDWDLFLSVFSEIHVGGHTFWHLSQQHPLAALGGEFDVDPLLEIYQAVDREIGHIAELVSRDNELVLFSIDSLVSDCLENARSVFLPEFLYRWNFPGKAALAPGEVGASLTTPQLDHPLHWKDEIWKLRTGDGQRDLQSPQEQADNNDTFNWQPTNWYKPLWHRMRAFALPSVADGYIRLNVKCREANGLVAQEDYESVCSQLIEQLTELVDARTGLPMVERVIRVRKSPFDINAQQSPADLIVFWQEESPTDVVQSPLVGRIGPVPYFRPGGHQKQGSRIENFFLVRAPDCPPGCRFSPGRLEDLPATILKRMGIATPRHFEGSPLTLIDSREYV